MKKILLTSIAIAGYGVSAFGQGSVIFENASTSTQPAITLSGGASNGQSSQSGLQVSLLWFNGTSFVNIDNYTSTYTTGNALQGPGYFTAGVVAVAGSGTQTFKVSATYNGYSGTTAQFTATANVSPTPAVSIDAGIPTPAGRWSGDLVLLTPVPEPTTIALGGLGAAALLLFRRRK